MAIEMGRIVYLKVPNSVKQAHQYVNHNGERIGEVWREQIDIIDVKGNSLKKWRWFASRDSSGVCIDEAGTLSCKIGYGSKDRAVDMLELMIKFL
jgi:hypothetical protein